MALVTLNDIANVLIGMLIMTCLIGGWGLLVGDKIRVNVQINDHPATPLRWWTGAGGIAAALGFGLSLFINPASDTLTQLNYHIVFIDMPILPIGAITMVLLIAPQHITWKRILTNFIPFIVLCPLCLVINQSWYTNFLVVCLLGYILAMMIYITIVGRRYEKTLVDEYSSLKGRSTRWLIGIIIFIGLIVLNIALFTTYHNANTNLLYYGFHLIAWNIVFSKIYPTVFLREKHAHDMDVDELAQEEAEDLRRIPLLSEDTKGFTKRLNELIEQEKVYCQDDLTRDDLAKKMEMSHTTFSKLLKVTTGLNFYEYINAIRIEKAAEMIQEGKMDVWSIGQTVGYRYRSTYYRAFAAKHGCTPAEYVGKGK